RKAADAFCARLPVDRRPPSLMMSLHLWALAHGIASLFARADDGRRRLPMSPEELLEAGVLVYLRGLSLIDEPSTLQGAGIAYVNVKYIHMRPFDDPRGEIGRFWESRLDRSDGGELSGLVATRLAGCRISRGERAIGALDRLRRRLVAA